MFWYKYILNIAWDMLILKHYLLFIWNSDITECPVFLFAKSSTIFLPHYSCPKLQPIWIFSVLKQPPMPYCLSSLQYFCTFVLVLTLPRMPSLPILLCQSLAISQWPQAFTNGSRQTWCLPYLSHMVLHISPKVSLLPHFLYFVCSRGAPW